ncbi:hypothetical protein [Thermocladium modestius]|uniref:hypothetical protein n=1 Tax=Thermocladium modestius TaxID=62609 RepID=UPI00166B0401|nr:hypothetical protein [Thermocladium modestius]
MVDVCPRCGEVGYREVKTIHGRDYVYYEHWGEKRRWCYVGPVGGYRHAQGVAASVYGVDLSLTNVDDLNPLKIAINALLMLEARLDRDEGRGGRSLLDGFDELEMMVRELRKTRVGHR